MVRKLNLSSNIERMSNINNTFGTYNANSM